MTLLIADLAHSIDMDRAALVDVIGAERLISNGRIRYGSWRNQGRSRTSFKRSRNWLTGSVKTTEYRHQSQRRTDYRTRKFLVSSSTSY